METIQKRLIGKEDISWDLSGNNEQNNYVFGNDSVAVSKINASHIPLTTEAREFLSAGNVDNALKNVHKKLNEFSASDGLTEDVVVEFEAKDTVEDIQQKINLQKKNLNGHTLTFVFPRFLEQILSETIVFKGFFNGAVIVTGGDENNLIPIYDQFDITSLFKIYRCQCEFIVEYFYFTHSHSKYAVLAESSTSVIFRNCVFSGTQKEDSLAVKLFASSGELVDCDFINESSDGISSSASGRAIGECFSYPASIPPEGAYLLNGQTIAGCNDLYPKFWEWVNTSGVRIIDNATFESELASSGVCGGFVIDTVAGSVRLPKWKYQAPLSGAPAVYGNGLTLGLTENLGVAISATSNDIVASDAAYGKPAGTEVTSFPATVTYQSLGVTTDPEKSGLVAGMPESALDSFVLCIQVFNAATALSEQESAQLASEMQMKAQTDLANVTANIDFIVKHEEAADGSWWYDLYRSGKVVQGGVTPSGATAAEMIISLPVEMADALYTPLVTIYGEDGFYLNGVTAAYYTVSKLTETGFSCYTGNANNTRRKFWRVEGKAATE